MDDLPPPPYASQDPHEVDPLLPRAPEDLIAYNAFIPNHNIAPLSGIPNRRPVGQPQRSESGGLQYPRSASHEDLSTSGFVSAGPYFELRPLTGPTPNNIGVHHLRMSQSTHPDSLIFPQARDLWIRRDVDDQDWLTFVNHLFPDRAIEDNVKFAYNLDLLRLSQRENEKRPGPPRQYSAGSAVSTQADPESRRLFRIRINAVCSQWNAGFFEPRGLRIDLFFPDDTPQYSDIPQQIIQPPVPCLSPSQTRSNNVLRKPPPKTEAEESQLLQAVAKGKKSNVKKLLDDGSEDLEAVGRKGETALYRSVVRGEDKIAGLLLAKGADPLARPVGANTPLYLAVSDERKGLVKLLLDIASPGIEVLSEKGESPLYCAVRNNNKTMVELLLNRRANPHSRPLGQESMLHRALSHGTSSIVTMLINHGANIEERNKDGDTPLCRCISRGESILARLLLERGANPTALNSKGEAPLSIAVARGESSIVHALLSQKALDLEVENEKGETPLYTAISRGDTSATNQLLVKGANPNAYPAASGDTMLNMAVSKGSSSLTHLLLAHGAEVNIKNQSGDPPLCTAVSKGDTSIVALLLGKKAAPGLTAANGEACLYRAVYRGDTSIVSLLLLHKADPNVRNPSGEACLYRAVCKSDASVTSLLLSHGADPHLRHTNGETPLYRAICKGDTSCVAILLGNGAWSGDEVVGNGETAMMAAVRKGNAGIVQLLGCYVKKGSSSSN